MEEETGSLPRRHEQDGWELILGSVARAQTQNTCLDCHSALDPPSSSDRGTVRPGLPLATRSSRHDFPSMRTIDIQKPDGPPPNPTGDQSFIGCLDYVPRSISAQKNNPGYRFP